MPLIVKEYSWDQSPSSLSLVVPIPGLIPGKADVLTSPSYIRIHHHPHIFEVFLWGESDDEGGSCTLDGNSGAVHFNFQKKVGLGEEDGKQPQRELLWPSLEAQGLDRGEKRRLREDAVRNSQQRHKTQAEASAALSHEQHQMSVREQIRLDQEERGRIAGVKEKEVQAALAEMRCWGDAGQGEILPGLQTPTPTPTPTPSVDIRRNVKMLVSFTPREFPTPARESMTEREAEWVRRRDEEEKETRGRGGGGGDYL